MINFLEVEQSVRVLKKQVEVGTLQQDEFEARLMEMVDIAEDGYYWMFGHKTEKWYRHDGRRWIRDNPDVALNPTEQNTAPYWDSIDVGWFILSLVLLGVVSGIIYTSAL